MHTTDHIRTQTAPVLCQRFPVVGMTCSHCEHAIATELRRIPGVISVVANAGEGSVTIECTREPDRDEVAAAGYQLAP